MSNDIRHFVGVIQQAREEERLKRWQALSALEWWEAIKTEVIIPALSSACEALDSLGVHGRVNGFNRSGCLMEVRGNSGSYPYLSFEWQPIHGWVNIDSTVKELHHAWTRDYFSEAEIVVVLDQFLKIVSI